MYHSLLKNAGIPDREDGRVHRLHDVRHTFCVYALEQMQEKGFDTYTSLPLLSVHKRITVRADGMDGSSKLVWKIIRKIFCQMVSKRVTHGSFLQSPGITPVCIPLFFGGHA